MSFSRLLAAVCSLVLLVASARADDPALRILSLEPTVLFPKREPLAQIARLTVVNPSGAAVQAEAVVTVAGGATEKSAMLTLAPNQSTVDVLVPDLAAAATVKVELRAGGKVLAAHEQPWQPQRKWKVFIVKSSHEDIGYENYIFKKQHDIANFIELGEEQSSPKSVAGNIGAGSLVMRKSPFHYTMETILFQRNYIEERGERAWRTIVENYLKPGYMSLEGAPSGVHSHWMDYEELARMTYPGRREVRDRFGLDLKTYMIVDNPSLSWSGMQAVADAGFKYVARWGQGWRSGGNNDYATTKVPAIFWWVGPNGKSRVLYSWRSHYSQGFWLGQTSSYVNLIDLGAENVADFLGKVQGGSVLGPYPYDALVTPEYIDHDIPRFDMRVIPAWAERYAYPQISVAGPETFFEYVEKKYGDTIPVLTGDLNNFSADYSSIDPVSQGWKRDAARLLPAAEGLGVLAGAMNPGFALRPADVERTYTRLFDYDEHCWPTLPRTTDEQLFNASWVKNHEARRALDASQGLFRQASAELVKNIAGQGEDVFAVFNPLVHPRTDLVTVAGSATAVTDLRTGKVISCAPAGVGRVSFLAENIPAFGYGLFKLGAGSAAAPAAPELVADKLSITNAFYTVRFDPVSGVVTSIVERAGNRELVDQAAPYRANQLVYVHKNSREAKEGFEYSPAKAVRMESRITGAKAEFDVWIEDAKLGGKIHQTVTLYAGIKRVDFANRLESIDVMWAPTYEDRYRDNLYYAFPFDVKGGQIRAEYPGGVVRPYDDQMRWGSHDYLYANRWIDVSNAAGGVTLAASEAGTFSFGEIRYNQFDVNYKPSKPWLFSYAWSNRMAGLLTLTPDDCNASFHYSLTSHDGDWNSGPAVRHGWQTGSPLLALPVPAAGQGAWTGKERSFLAVDAANIQLSVLKASGQSGRGWIARLVETDGRTTECELDASALGVTEAMLCNLVEDDGTPLVVKGGKVRVPVQSFGFATVRLLAGPVPAATGAIAAGAVTDSTITLQWAASTGAVGYNIYRSDDPDAPASAYAVVARVASPSFTDRDLSPNAPYYYRVAAVTAANREGPVSAQATIKTSAENTSPPSPVHELGVVRRAGDTLIVYWRRNPEPDVARYEVYRSEKPDFSPEGMKPVAVLAANSYFLQVYRDSSLQPGRTYYYRVLPVDWSDHRQAASPVAGATTPKEQL